MLKYFYLLLNLYFLCINGKDTNTLKLKMASVLYRHGDRSPTNTFPNDQHFQFWKKGLGQLTELGMSQEFKMGKFLKERYGYGKLLNESYLRKQVYCRSSDKDRCIMSAEAQMAGLYPPKYEVPLPKDKDWQFWQLIPIHTVPRVFDELLRPPFMNCPRYKELEEESYNKPEYKAMEEKYKDFIYNVSMNVGLKNPVVLEKIYTITDVFVCQRAHNLSLPKWVTTEVFNTLVKLETFGMGWYFASHEKQRLSGGPLLGKMIENMKKFVENPETSQKLFVYSAHDTTVAALLSTLGVYNGILPPYSALFLMELYQDTKTEEHFVRMFYRNDTTTGEPYELSLPNCDPGVCTLKMLTSATLDVIPTDFEAECQSKNMNVICKECSQQNSCKGFVAAIVIILLLFLLFAVGFLVRRYQSKRRSNYRKTDDLFPITEGTAYDSE